MIRVDRINTIVEYLILTVMGLVTLLLVLRSVIVFADINPFRRWVLVVRRWTDPMTDPVRRTLAGFGVSYKLAPLICIVFTLVLGYVAIEFTFSVTETVANTADAIARNNFAAAAGFLLYGLLGLYGALLIIRIIFSWAQVSSSNVWLRRLSAITDPILIPLRRRIPPVGRFDLSPLVAFFAIWILQQIVVATLIRGFQAGL